MQPNVGSALEAAHPRRRSDSHKNRRLQDISVEISGTVGRVLGRVQPNSNSTACSLSRYPCSGGRHEWQTWQIEGMRRSRTNVEHRVRWLTKSDVAILARRQAALPIVCRRRMSLRGSLSPLSRLVMSGVPQSVGCTHGDMLPPLSRRRHAVGSPSELPLGSAVVVAEFVRILPNACCNPGSRSLTTSKNAPTMSTTAVPQAAVGSLIPASARRPGPAA